MKLYKKIQLIKQVSGFTQEELARVFGVSFVTLNSWINDRSVPRAKKVQLIDKLYLKYTGQKSVPDNELQAKKDALFKKGRKYKSVLKRIMTRSDLFAQVVLSLTYNTNSIEGSTLTENETAGILFHNAMIKNKDFIEHLEAKNHQTALHFLFDEVGPNFKVNEEFVLKLHQILMNSIRSDAGSYRCHGVRIVGANVPTANYLRVPAKMKELVREINKKRKDVIAHCAFIHASFEQIHPFSDGNGRVGRLIMIAMLLRANLAPALILQERKRLYYQYLQKAQQAGDYVLLEDFICDSVLSGFMMLET